MSDERIFDHQDWKTLIVKTNKKKDESKKPSKKLDDTTQKLMKVENKADNDIFTKEFRIAMVQKRTKTLNMTQKQLATRLNMPEKTIKEIESGKAIYNAGHYNRIKRVLKIT
jgi:ribosome-binding protein aMBF1 (putative translation factor)